MANAQNLQALLEQTGWIHALARRLVREPHLAEDLAQDTWVDALEGRPDARGPVRGWLATVMRNNLLQLRRTERHRLSREQGSSRAELEPSALDVVERAETHRNVVLAVLALDEPYRSTLLMRFFEQLSYAEIARRTGVGRAGVNSRITRGLELLRQRLESTYGGDRRALALALIPLAKLPTGLATTIFGVKLMHAALGTTAVTLLAFTVSLGLSRDGRRPAATPGTATAGAASGVRADGELQAPPALTERAPLAAEPAADARQQERRESEEKLWKAELFHSRSLPVTVESLSVSTGSGDIELLESAGGLLEVQARVQARLGTVPAGELTQVFEDHVDITEEEGTLRIENRHRDSRGWTVSFVVHVPGRFPLAANTASGDIVVRHAGERVAANTASGDVLLDLARQRVRSLQASAASGDIVVEVLAVEGELDVNTASGDVAAHVADASSPGKAQFKTASGDIHLVVPPGVVGSFDLETAGGAIVLPPSLGLQVREDGDGRLARGSVGSGGGSYMLRSASGSLEVELGHGLPVEPR